MFFVIEGTDASGKKTQTELISSLLQSLGKSVAVVDFPRYSEPSSYFVREYLAGNFGTSLPPELISSFYSLDRFAAKQQIEKYLSETQYLIANRYTTSNIIYSACKIQDPIEREKFVKNIEYFEYEICGLPEPDTVFYLSLSFKNNLKLLEERIGGLRDIHEKDSEYLARVSEFGKRIAQEKGWTIINCEKNGEILSKTEIRDTIFSHIETYEKNRR